MYLICTDIQVASIRALCVNRRNSLQAGWSCKAGVTRGLKTEKQIHPTVLGPITYLVSHIRGVQYMWFVYFVFYPCFFFVLVTVACFTTPCGSVCRNGLFSPLFCLILIWDLKYKLVEILPRIKGRCSMSIYMASLILAHERSYKGTS